MAHNLEPLFDSRFRKHRLWIIVVSLFIMFTPFLLTRTEVFGVQFSDTGGIGDTLGGIMGPFIGIGAGILTYLAFYMQFKANEDQRGFFKTDQERLNSEILKQDQEKKKDKVFTQYYEMLRIHIQNISEVEIRSPGDNKFWSGRRCFVYMFSELKLISEVLEHSIKTTLNGLNVTHHSEINDSEFLSDLIYRTFFFGIQDKDHYAFDSLNDGGVFLLGKSKEKLTLWANFHFHLIEYQEQYHELSMIPTNVSQYGSISFNVGGKGVNHLLNKKVELYYYPFDGHIVRLGHTYRHLYHTVKFVVAQNEKNLTVEETLGLLRMLRAQLSNHEQLLLYYNGLSIGKNWFANNYFTDWKMIHNLQLPLANFGIIPEEHPTIVKWLDENPNKQHELFEWPLTIYKPKIPNPSQPV